MNQRLTLSFVTALTVVLGGVATARAQVQAQIDFFLTPLGGNDWRVSATASGDTSGIAGFALDIFGTVSEIDGTDFDFAPLTGLLNTSPLQLDGFTILLNREVGEPNGTRYSIGAIQQDDGSVNFAVFGVGLAPGQFGAGAFTEPFDNPIVLGTLTTPVALEEGMAIEGGGTGNIVSLGPIEIVGSGYAPGNDGGSFLDDDELVVTITVIPEPSTVALIGLGMVMLMRRRP